MNKEILMYDIVLLLLSVAVAVISKLIVDFIGIPKAIYFVIGSLIFCNVLFWILTARLVE